MVQGNNGNTRVGKKISMVSVEVKGTIRLLGRESSTPSNQPSPPSAKSIWVALVMDRQNDGRTTAFDTAEVYFQPLATTSGRASVVRNLDFIDQFKVIASKQFDVGDRSFLKEVVADTAAGIVADYYSWGEQIFHFHFYHVFKKPLQVRMTGNTGNIDDIIDNALHVVSGYGVESETDSAPVLNYASRVRFIDV